MSTSPRYATAFSIAGHDPSSGAGVTADLRTFDELGVYGMAVVTSLTFQNSTGVHGRFDLPPDIVAGQLSTLLSDVVPSVFKIGMVGRTDTLMLVANLISKQPARPLVLDPVLESSSGEPLIEEGGLEVIERVLPHVTLLTPNRDELARLCGFEVFDVNDVKAGALKLAKKGARAVLVTGVKVQERSRTEAVDVLMVDGAYQVYPAPWIDGLKAHGSGCVMSSAAAAFLAMGRDLKNAVEAARTFTHTAMRRSVTPGEGDPFANPRGSSPRRPKEYLSYVKPSPGA